MTDVLPRSADGNRFARAVDDAWTLQLASMKQRMDGSGYRHILAAVDALTGLLEERNLRGRRTIDRELRERLRLLEAEIGFPLPRKVVRARTTTRLHAVLLDLRETLLDLFRPERLAYPDVHDEDWNAD